MRFGLKQKFARENRKSFDIEENPAYRLGSEFLREFLLLVTREFHLNCTEAFKGYMTTTLSCNVKTTKSTLLQKTSM